jgi:tetratricopeptide (TPR) repeat protein
MSSAFMTLKPGTLALALLAAMALVTSLPAYAQAPRKAPSTQPTAPRPSAAQLDAMAKQAERARNEGEIKKSIDLYAEVLKWRPSWAEGWWYLGTMQYDKDQYAEAVPVFQKLVKLEPKLGSAWAFLGLCEFETGNLKASLQHLQLARKLGVDDESAARTGDYHLAVLLNLNGKFEEAASVLLSQFGREQMTPQVATAMGMSLLHMQMLPTALDISRKELVFTAGQALAQMAHERFAEALDLLQPLEAQYPDVPFLKYSSALALVSLKRFDDALTKLQAELLTASTNPEPFLLQARIHLERNNLLEALKATQQAVALKPKSPYGHAMLAQCYLRMGKRVEAAREFALAESLGLPNNPPMQPSQPVEKRAPKPATKISDISPNTAASTPANDAKFAEIEKRIETARQANDIDSAVAAYREGLELRPEWADGLLYVSTYYYSNERYSDALALAQRLVKLQSGVGTAWALLGLCEFQLGSFDDALVHLSRGRGLGFPPGGGAVSEANYHTGILLNWRGDFDAARTLLLQESKGPRAADAKFALGISLLRLKQLPAQIKADERQMVEVAGDIALDLSRSDYTPACSRFDDLLKQYPTRSYIYNAYGWTLLSISRFDAAVEQYKRQLEVDPKAADAYLGLSTAAIKTSNFAQAKEAATKAVELDPTSAMAHGQLGRALLGLNEVDKGIAELETAVHLAVNIPELHYSLSRAYAKAGRTKEAERERQIFLRLNKEASKK